MTLFGIFILAFFVRLINLNQSLWLDEAVVAKVVQTIPFHLIPVQFSPGDFHPPLYYLFMSMWTMFFGTSEIALRMPSVLFSLVAGWFVYRIGCELKNKTVGLWSAIFFLFNPLIVYYSQEARMYMMAVMLLSVSLFFFLQQIKAVESRKSKVKNLIFFNLFSGLAFATFYGSVFFIVTMILAMAFVIPTKVGIQKKTWIAKVAGMMHMVVGLVLTGAFLSQLIFQQLQTARFGLQDVSNWSLVLGKAELKNFAMVFIKFTSGRISWFPKWSYYMVAGIWSLVVGLLLLFSAKKNKLFAFLFSFPLIIGLIISFWVPMMQYFRFLYLIVPMSILVAVSIIPIRQLDHLTFFRFLDFARNDVLRYFIIVGFFLFSLAYLLLPQFHREDWKSLAHDIKSTQPVYMILPSSDPVVYYRNDLMVYELRDIRSLALPETIQVIPYVSEIYGYNYNAELTKKGCIKTNESTYRGPVILEEWKCLKNA